MAASTYLNQIQQLYIAYFGRPADPAGLTFWATQVDAANGSVAAVIAGFSASSESNALYAGVPTAQKVSAIYLNLFNRLPEANGLAYWVAQIDSGAVTQAQAAYQIQSSAGPGDATAVANKLAMANSFTAQIDTAAEISGYSGAIAAAYGRAYLASVDATPASVSSANNNLLSAVATATGTSLSTPVTPAPVTPAGATYALTTGIDNLTGTAADDLFTALIDTTTTANSTLTTADTINGGAGTDTLSLTVQGATNAIWPAANISNIERLLISDRHTGGSNSLYNLSGVTGLTTVASNVSNGSVSFTGLQAGTTVAMIGDGATALGNISVNGSGNVAVNLLISGGTKGTPTISNTGSATTATINSTGAANTLGQVTLTTSNFSITSLTINAATDLKAALNAFDYTSTSTLTVTGAGKVDLGKATSQYFIGSTINASANSGGLTTAVSASIKNFVGSSGDDRLYGTSRLINPVSIDGGVGIDTVSTRLIDSNNAADFKNFEVLDLTGGVNNGGALDVSQMTVSTITGVLLDGDTVSDVTLSGLSLSPSGFNVNVTGNSGNRVTTLNFNDVSATNDVLNYTFNPTLTTAAYAGTVRSDGIETININSGGISGANNSLAITDDALKSLVITGDRALNVTVNAQNGIAGVSQLTSIDGSAATGSLQVTLSTPSAAVQSALSIKTGSGSDYIKVSTSSVAGSVGSTVTTGTGTDTIVLTTAIARDTNAVQFTTITDYALGDRISFSNTLSFNSAQVSFGATPTSLSEALTQASLGVATNTARWFTYDSNTYIVDNADGVAGFSSGDIVVKLSGTVNLSTATAQFGFLLAGV